MPIQYWIDKPACRIVANVTGNFSMQEILEAVNGAVLDPEFEPGFDILSDHTEVGEPITSGQAQQLTAHLQSLSQHLRGARWAVVTIKPASFGMMRMLSVYLERIPIEMRAFRSREEAENWLALRDTASGVSR